MSAFEEMGLRLRLDMPEQAMEVTSVFFRNSTPSSEARVCTPFWIVHQLSCLLKILYGYSIFVLFLVKENMKSMAEQRTKNLKALQEKTKLNQKEAQRFNPVGFYFIPLY